MPSSPSTTVLPKKTEAKIDKNGSSSDSARMATSYPKNPVGGAGAAGAPGPLKDDETLKANFQELCLDGVVNDGFMFSSFNRDYTANGAPSFDDVEVGGGGLPASPWVPNPVSPDSSFDPASQPAPPEGFGASDEASGQYGSGVEPHFRVPKETSEKIQGQTLGNYSLGKAYEV